MSLGAFHFALNRFVKNCILASCFAWFQHGKETDILMLPKNRMETDALSMVWLWLGFSVWPFSIGHIGVTLNVVLMKYSLESAIRSAWANYQKRQ